jgi:transposase-like protein
MIAETISAEEMPRTLMQAVRYFADPVLCERLMRAMKWPDGKITCECGATGDRIVELESRNCLRCKDCRKMIYSKRGTIFEDSPLGLDKWFVAVWVIANCKNGVSSHELARSLGVRQPTAWFMLHRIRLAMQIADPDKFDGPAEADATYIGGRAANMHKSKREKRIRGRGAVGKAIVHGVLQRGSDAKTSAVRCEVVGSDDATKLVPHVRRNVRFGAEVFTDEATAYGPLADTQVHRAVDHSIRYAEGTVHTNGLENFWSLLKRGLGGTYVAVAPFHLFRYVAEQAFRFNERSLTDGARFIRTLRGITGKRLTYRLLTAQNDAGFMTLK